MLETQQKKLNSNKTLVICPVFNESHNLDKLLLEFKKEKLNVDLLFVDSGSTDDSYKKIKKFKFQVLQLPRNLGVGNALVQGIKVAISKNYDIVCIIGGNGKMRPFLIPQLINPIINNDIDFVQGSRYLNSQETSSLPFFRKITIPLITKLFSALFRYSFTDATCGFRAFKVELIKNANFNISAKWLRGYAFEPYLFSNVILDSNISKIEIPVTMDYPKHKLSYTKIKPIINYPALFFPYLIAYFFPKKFTKKYNI